MFVALLTAVRLAVPQAIDSTPPQRPLRTIAIDERLGPDAGIQIGDRLIVSARPSGPGDTVVVSAFVRRSHDPSEVARGDYRVRLHLDDLQRLLGYGERVDRFAVAATGRAGAADSALRAINDAAFGFQAYRSHDIAVETSATFLVVSRFHRAIGSISIVASAVFLLCIMLLKVDERRRDVAALRVLGISAGSIVRAIVLEAALIAAVGSALGVGLGAAVSSLVNWHYREVYRTPLTFSLVTGPIVATAVLLSLVLGVAAGWIAAQRLVRKPPLALLGR